MGTVLEHNNQDSVPQAFQRESQSSQAHPSRTIIHTKLEMTEPGDHDEREADAVANTIVSGGKIARKISGEGSSSGIAVSQQMESQLSQLQGGGRQMPEGLRNMMESGFGQDFSQVRIHTDNTAAEMSDSISARAFTYGNDIFFNRSQFCPDTKDGQHLIAHELTHVAQGNDKLSRQLPSVHLSDMISLETHLNEDFYQPDTDNWEGRFLIEKNYPTDPQTGKMLADCDVLASESIRQLERSGTQQNAVNSRILEMETNALTKQYDQLSTISGFNFRYDSYTPIVLPAYHMLMLIKVKNQNIWYLQDGQQVYLIKNVNQSNIKNRVCGYVYRKWGSKYFAYMQWKYHKGGNDFYYANEHIENPRDYRNEGSNDDFVDVQTIQVGGNAPIG